MSVRTYKSGAEKRKKQSAQMAEMSKIPKLTIFLAQTPAVSSHLVDEESTSGQIECEQVTAVAEQSETNTFIVSSLADSAVTELYRLKSVDKDPAHWSIIDDHLRQVIVSREGDRTKW